MILIADGGSTKVEWAVADEGRLRHTVVTSGLNPVLLTTDAIEAALRLELLAEIVELPECVIFYGAGCIPGEPSVRMAEALHRVFGGACRVEINTDLLGAARSVCGHSSGIACILGTGSNSCVYDGAGITANVSPLGYILGDEGSGAVLGRRLVSDVFKAQLPADLCDRFIDRYRVDRSAVIAAVYRGEAPNRYLASFVPFLSDNIDRREIRELVCSEFIRFLTRNVLNYEGCRELPLNFVGSVAYYFSDVLRDAVARCGCRMGHIVQRPMPGLLKYHAVEVLNEKN